MQSLRTKRRKKYNIWDYPEQNWSATKKELTKIFECLSFLNLRYFILKSLYSSYSKRNYTWKLRPFSNIFNNESIVQWGEPKQTATTGHYFNTYPWNFASHESVHRPQFWKMLPVGNMKRGQASNSWRGFIYIHLFNYYLCSFIYRFIWENNKKENLNFSVRKNICCHVNMHISQAQLNAKHSFPSSAKIDKKIHPLTWWLRIFATSFVPVDSFLSVFMSEILCKVLFVLLSFDFAFRL